MLMLPISNWKLPFPLAFERWPFCGPLPLHKLLVPFANEVCEFEFAPRPFCRASISPAFSLRAWRHIHNVDLDLSHTRSEAKEGIEFLGRPIWLLPTKVAQCRADRKTNVLTIVFTNSSLNQPGEARIFFLNRQGIKGPEWSSNLVKDTQSITGKPEI